MLGDKDWEPKDSRLVILEGPELADDRPLHGQGLVERRDGPPRT